MTDWQPFRFEDFSAENTSPVLDLNINRRTFENAQNELLADINDKLAQLLENQMKNNIKALKIFLDELMPSLADEYGETIISDFLSRRFPDLSTRKNLKICVNADNVEVIENLLQKLSATKGIADRVSVCKDNSLAKSDCRIVWDEEEELFSTAEILSKIRNRLKGVMSDD